MKNKQIFILIFFLTAFFSAVGQKEFRNTEKIPEEKVFVHYNSTFLMPGEDLYYKIYCLNTETKKLSTLSKIAYIELIGTNMKTIFRDKIILHKGTGNGTHFISSEIRSGNYKLIAYTQWMKNKQLFFAGDISIVNPYQTNKEIIAKNTDPVTKDILPEDELYKNNTFELTTDKETYSTREKVRLKISNLNSISDKGNFSLSVRKTDLLKTADELHAIETDLTTDSPSDNQASKGFYLPELRGEILSGKVVTLDNDPASGQKVALSIPGKNFIYKISGSDSEGKFYFSIGKEYDGKQGIFQIIGKDREQYKVIPDKPERIEFPNLSFFDLKISEKDRNHILKHSVYNQIQNSFASLRPDSIKKVPASQPFFGSQSKKYLLDDYTRFPSLHETVVEIIPEVYIRKQNLHVRVYENDIETGLTSLVLVDGVMVQDQKNLISFNARKIKTIEVIDKMYLYGSQIFEGVISIQTFDDNYSVNTRGEFIQKINLFKPLDQKIFYKQIYDNLDKFKRIPDYRIQLFWEPDVGPDKNEGTYFFFTSDLTGSFEIVLEGFTSQGKPVTLTKSFQVE